MEKRFVRARALEALAESTPLGVEINGLPVLLCRVGERVHAVIDRCPHAMARLSAGRVRRGRVSCPLHGAWFDLENGRCIGGSYSSLRVFEVRIVDGWVEVSVPDGRASCP